MSSSPHIPGAFPARITPKTRDERSAGPSPESQGKVTARKGHHRRAGQQIGMIEVVDTPSPSDHLREEVEKTGVERDLAPDFSAVHAPRPHEPCPESVDSNTSPASSTTDLVDVTISPASMTPELPTAAPTKNGNSSQRGFVPRTGTGSPISTLSMEDEGANKAHASDFSAVRPQRPCLGPIQMMHISEDYLTLPSHATRTMWDPCPRDIFNFQSGVDAPGSLPGSDVSASGSVPQAESPYTGLPPSEGAAGKTPSPWWYTPDIRIASDSRAAYVEGKFALYPGCENEPAQTAHQAASYHAKRDEKRHLNDGEPSQSWQGPAQHSTPRSLVSMLPAQQQPQAILQHRYGLRTPPQQYPNRQQQAREQERRAQLKRPAKDFYPLSAQYIVDTTCRGKDAYESREPRRDEVNEQAVQQARQRQEEERRTENAAWQDTFLRAQQQAILDQQAWRPIHCATENTFFPFSILPGINGINGGAPAVHRQGPVCERPTRRSAQPDHDQRKEPQLHSEDSAASAAFGAAAVEREELFRLEPLGEAKMGSLALKVGARGSSGDDDFEDDDGEGDDDFEDDDDEDNGDEESEDDISSAKPATVSYQGDGGVVMVGDEERSVSRTCHPVSEGQDNEVEANSDEEAGWTMV